MAYGIGQYIADNTDSSLCASFDENKINQSIAKAQELIGNTEHIANTRIDKLGVQAKPGSFFVLNNELIEIGRTGTYELIFNSIAVTSLKVLSPTVFIIDYKYAL